MYRAVRLVLSIRIVLILSYLLAVSIFYCPPLQAQTDWRIEINANLPGLLDQGDLTIASQDSASAGYDSFDQPHPPALPNRYLDLYTQHGQNETGWGNQPFPTTEYISEWIPSLDQPSYHFPFYLRTDQNGNLNLSWKVIDDEVLSGYDISLHDPQTSTVVDMRQTSTIIINVTAGIRPLEIELTTGRAPPPVAAFTVGGIAGNVAIWRNNIASVQEGASIVQTSSQNNSNPSTLTIDDNFSTRWISATGQNTNQFITVKLPRGELYRFDKIRIVNASVTGGTAIKNFDLLVSDNNVDFTPAFSGTALDITPIQEFSLPAPIKARFVKLLAKDNYGSTCCISINSFEIVDSNLSGTPSYSAPATFSSYRTPAERPEMMLDSNTATAWVSATGQTTNQFVKLSLADGRSQLIDRVIFQSVATNEAIKDFEVYASDTTLDDASFSLVVDGTVANNANAQQFIFPSGPIRARYLKVVAKNNYGSSSVVRVVNFEARTLSSDGNIISLPASGINVARLESPSFISNGAVVISSSGSGNSTNPQLMLDAVFGSPWFAAGTTQQFAKIQLGGGLTYTLTGVRIAGRMDSQTTQSVKDFEVWASSNSQNDADFSLVFSATVPNDRKAHEFLFPNPVPAKFVKYVAVNNYGGPSLTATGIFEIITAETGGILQTSSTGIGAADSDELFDGDSATFWSTSSGSISNQFATVQLSGGVQHNIFGISVHAPSATRSVKDFEVWVSATTADDVAFQRVLTATAINNNTVQIFNFNNAYNARYVRFIAKNNYGDSCCINVTELRLFESPPNGAIIHSTTNGSVGSAVDFNGASGTWITTSNTNQFVKFLLPGGNQWLIDRIRLERCTTCPINQTPRDFEVQVSNTSADDWDFITVLAGTLRQNLSVQDFYFAATPAKFVRVLLKNNWGDPTTIALQNLWIFSPQIGGLQTRFIDQSFDSDGNIIAYAWDFGDGSTSTERDPLHTFASAGTYTVSLTVTDDDNQTDTFAIPFYVFAPPQADFSFTPTVPSEHGTAHFTDLSIPVAGAITLRSWNFGDGGGSAATNPQHIFEDNGIYSVSLTVTNTRGLQSTAVKQISVSNVPPSVNAGQDRTLVWGETWNKPISVSDISPIDNPTLVCNWDFGDGQTAQILNCNSSTGRVPHAYSLPGIYTATLTVSDKDEGTTTDTVTLTIIKRKAPINIFAAQNADANGNVEIAARLFDAFNLFTSMQGKPVAFNLGSQNVSATTDAEGIATAVLNFPLNAPATVTVNFATDTFYEASSDSELFSAIPGFPELPTIQHDKSEVVSLLPGVTGLSHGGDLTIRGLPGGYDPAFIILHPDALKNPAGPNPIIGFDTLVLNGICDSPTDYFANSTFLGRIEQFALSGGKIILWDSECANTNYLQFFVPFDSTPTCGTNGNTGGAVQDKEDNSLSSTNSSSPYFIDFAKIAAQTDAINDFNSFNASDPNWCGDCNADNSCTSLFMTVQSYAQVGRSVVIYNGVDRDYLSQDASQIPTNSGAYQLMRMWLLELLQPWNPTGLACSVGFPIATISIQPASASLQTGQTHTVTATVKKIDNSNYANVYITLHATGPNPRILVAKTDPNGIATFQYVGRLAGVDSIVAKAGIVTSNTVTANWNGAPTANAGQDQNVSVGLNVILDGSASTDPNSDPLTYQWSQTSGPAVVLNNANQAVANFTAAVSGTYEFKLTVSDGVFSDSDSVTIQTSDLNNAPVAQDQSLSTDEDTILPVTLSATDSDGDSLTFSVITGPSHGTLSGTAPNLSYTPDQNFNGSDEFTFQVNDGQLDSNVATISITIQPVNDAPEADNQSVSTNEDVSANITLTGSDAESDVLTFEIVTQPANGSLSGAPPNIIYQPNPNYSGTDSFTFKANDSQLDSNIATVSITVASENDPPQANDQSVSTDEDVSVSITLGATDADNDPLTYTIVTQPLLGSLSGVPLQLTYHPNPNSNGQDSFTFRVNDGQTDSNIATVNINVNAINDAPQAFDQSVATNENSPVTITLTGSDAENSALTYAIISQPAHGNLTGAPPQVTYQPNANYSGPDSFTFRVNDGQADSNIATVSITVNEVNSAPNCSQASASPNELWPPNHKWKSISISGITDPEGDSFTVQVNQIKQDEPVNGQGDGDTSPDATITPLQLRSERSGNGDGRVYHILFTATDNQNHSCTGEVTVCVRHDVPSACVDEGAVYDSTQP